MPTITKEQALKRQASAPEGWLYDIRHFVLWNEHQLLRKLPQDDGSIVIGYVSFRENQEKRTNDYGCSWTVYAGNYSPVLTVRRWTESGSGSDVWTSSGLGNTKKLSEEKLARRNYKALCKFAASVSDELIMDLLTGKLQAAV